jgi:hypothetical protein
MYPYYWAIINPPGAPPLLRMCGVLRSDGVPCDAEYGHYGGHEWPDSRPAMTCHEDVHVWANARKLWCRCGKTLQPAIWVALRP